MAKNILRIGFIGLFIISAVSAQSILNESFSETTFPPPGWATYDNVLDYWINDRNGPHVAPGCAFAGKFGGNPHNPSDAWLVTPRLQPIPGHNTLEFWYRGFNKNQYESLEIWVSRAGQDYASFMNPLTGVRVAWIGMQTWDYTKYTLSLASFNNQLIHIAFRYVGTNPNRHGVFIDEVKDNGGGGVTYPKFDVGVSAIVRPDTLELPSQIFPEAVVKNYGSLSVSNFWTRCVIETITGARTIYRDSVATSLVNDQSKSLTFKAINLTGGLYRIKFKTLLSGDAQPKNDSMVRIFRVIPTGYLDAGVSAIIAPMGEVQYNSVHYPQIQVRNYSARAERIPATIQIKNLETSEIVYTGNVSGDTIQPFKSKLYIFPTSWLVTVGVYEIIAYTTLANDQDRTNDTIKAGAVCSSIDVAVLSIESPSALVEPNQSVIPSARVVNYGWSTQTFDVTFKIGSGYTDTKSVLLNAGNDTIISFKEWLSDTFTYAVRCSTYLAGDMRALNNVKAGQIFVPVRDIQPVVFLAPTEDTIEPIQFVPQIVIKSNGNYRIPAAPVIMTITNINGDTVCYETEYVNLFAYGTAIASFRNWNPEWYGESSIYYINVRTFFPYDQRPANDFISRTVYVRRPFRDVALVQINSPRDSVGTDYPLIPKVTIVNLGNIPIPGFEVITQICYPDTSNIVYSRSERVTSQLLPGRSTQLTFPSFQPNPNSFGKYPIISYIAIEDSNPDNNRMNSEFEAVMAVTRDVRVPEIISPTTSLIPIPTGMNSAIKLAAKVSNAGNVDAVNLPVIFKVTRLGLAYANYDNQTIIDLPKRLTPGYISNVFQPVLWIPDTGTYVITVTTPFQGDQSPQNNTKSCTVTVYFRPDYGWKGLQVSPYSVSDGGALTYVPNKGIFAFAGGKTTFFARYDITSKNWTPLAAAPRAVEKGAALCNDGNNTIYAVLGGARDFWAYNIENNQWTRLESVPAGPKNKKLSGGSGLAFVPKADSLFLFLVKAGGTYEFYPYYVQGQTWLSPRESVPKGYSDKKPSYGTSVATDGDNYIYVLKSACNELWVYNVANNIWQMKRILSANNKAVKAGGALVHNQANKLYAFTGGNTTELWRYTITNDNWNNTGYNIPTPPDDKKKINKGAALTCALGEIYAFKGNKSAAFLKLIPSPQEDQVNSSANTVETQMLIKTNIGLTPVKMTVRPNIIRNDVAIVQYQVNNLQPITINLYNIVGNLVKSEQKQISTKTGLINLDVSDVPAGIYFLQFKTDKETLLEKVVVQK